MEETEPEEKADLREQNIMKRKAIVSYKYDKENMMWCEVVMDFTLTGANIMMSSVLEDLAKKSLVWKIAGLSTNFDPNRWHVFYSYKIVKRSRVNER